ncbi:hypothetical protein K492DRAFT_237586 [Lichtheimia hyalospora FSU 10163]|nr:hypothetical protein K492DRAFT_237586 [Lichtheimia hyalospora FSU 10163]
MGLEQIVDQQISDGEDIGEIAATLQEGQDLDMDPNFCSSIIPQLLLHSLSHIYNAHDHYSNAIAIALKEVCKSSVLCGRQHAFKLLRIINGMTKLLHARLSKPPYEIDAFKGTIIQNSTSAINLIVNAWGALVEMVHECDPDDMQTLYPNIWSKLVPVSSLAMTASPHTAVYLLKVTATLYHKCIPNNLIHPCGSQSENYILVLLQSIKRIITTPNIDIPEHLFHDLAQTIRTWLILFPPTMLVDVVGMANALETLAMHSKSKPSIDIELHVSKRLRLDESELMDTEESANVDGFGQQENDRGLDTDEHMKYQWLKRMFKETLSSAMMASDDELERKSKEVFAIVNMIGAHKLDPTQSKMLAEYAASCISKDDNIIAKLAEMHSLEPINYLRRNMRYILPYLLGASQGNTELQSFAFMLDISVRSLCEQGAHHLLVAFLMADDQVFAERGFDQMRDIFLSDDAPQELLSTRQNKVITLLAMELGVPGKMDKAQQALQTVMQWLKLPATTSLGDLLSQFFLGISHKIAAFISEKRDPYKCVQNPSALASFNCIIRIMGSAIASQAHQATAIIQTVGELPNMQNEAFMLWKTYTEQLSHDELFRRISAIIQGSLVIFPHCSSDIRKRIGEFLVNAINECTSSKGLPEGLPDVPEFEELHDLRLLLDKKRLSTDLNDELASIAERTQSDDILDMLSAAQELLRLLELYGNMHLVMVDNRSLLYTALLNLARKSFDHAELQRLTAECLGILGATDPTQVDAKIPEENRPILRNFKNKDENREFICELITKHLIPAFHSTGNELVQQYIQYAIQMELQQAGFTPDSIHNSATIQSRWNKLPSATQSLLTPLLRSSFQSKWEMVVPDYPIYLSAESYSEWIKRWLYRLVETSDETVRPIFTHCFPVVQGNLGLALTLLPHIVLHVLLSGSDKDRKDIREEIIGVLEHHEEQSRPWSEQMQRASLQVVVMITGHCRRWLRHAQENALTSSNTSEIRRVHKFLDSIPNGKMAMASFRSKAYAQALMHLELHVKNNQPTTSEVIEFLRQVYAHMEEKDGMAAIFMLFQRNLSVEEEILQFESRGDWEHAKVCYTHALERNPYDSQLLSGYFNCQRQSGDHIGMLGAATKLLQTHQDWFPRINAYRAEAAWKTGDWDMLDMATSLPMERSFDSFLSSAIANIRRGDNLAALSDISNARKDLMEQLATTSKESFPHSHDLILRLQMLHELEQSQIAWEKAQHEESPEPINELRDTWKKQFLLLSPSYATRRPILELRQTILFGLRWEKLYYSIARFYEKCMKGIEIAEMQQRDFRLCNYAVKYYLEALSTGSKYFYHVMPRILSIWMQFAAAASISDTQQEFRFHKDVMNFYNAIIGYLRERIPRIEAYKFCLVLPRLVSRLSHERTDTGEILVSIISKVFTAYPSTTIWALQPPQESPNENMRGRASMIISKASTMYKPGSKIPTIIRHAHDFMVPFKELAFHDSGRDFDRISIKNFPKLAKMRNLEICIPTQKAMIPALPESIETEDYNPYAEDLPRIDGFVDRIDVMRSMQRPKKLSLIGTDGKTYTFLCKTQDDLRKDARLMEFSHMINRFLRHDSDARQRALYIRTFGVIPLGEQWGLIEWISNLSPLKVAVGSMMAKDGIDIRRLQYLAKHQLESATTVEAKCKAFVEILLPKCPPVFHRWFLHVFPDPNQWFASRCRYIKTLAVMSIVGYILGLGDRHAENILFDSSNGDCVHVDVNMLFDKGQQLNVPEIVPFRLTQNLVDGMGLLGYEGMFRKTCEVTLCVLRHNKIQLLSVFETLLYDPIVEWKRKHNIQAEAKKKMNEISQKINGVNDKIPHGMSINEQVQMLISEATDNTRLAQMFVGWAPFI